MKHSRQIPRKLAIEALVSIVWLGVIALGLAIATARLLDTPV